MSVIARLIEGPGSLYYEIQTNLIFIFKKTLKSMVLNSVHSKQLKVEKLVSVLKLERGVRIEKKIP